jgi:hypothetical protein
MIYFDEAGNSGSNLLDNNQPVFVLLSHNYSDAESEILLEKLKSLSQAEELHFAKLKKFQKFRNAIIDCLNHDLIQENRMYHYYAHKRYMICIQIVDQLIEPVYYDLGEDIYKSGKNLSTANLMYILSSNNWDKDIFNEMCGHFVKWMRYANENDCKLFYEATIRLHSNTLEIYRDILNLILLSAKFIKSITGAISKYTLDATLSCFVDHCNYWAKIYKDPFDITFDDSKQIEYWKEMIAFLTDALPSAEVGYDSRMHKYPLLINTLKTGTSISYVGLQLADVLASSINHVAVQIHNNKMDDFSNEIMKSRLFNNTIGNRMWPSNLITAEELNMTNETGINPLDFMADAAMMNKEAYDKTKKK